VAYKGFCLKSAPNDISVMANLLPYKLIRVQFIARKVNTETN